MPSFPTGFYAEPTQKFHDFTTFSELTLGSTTESGYTGEVPFISSLITSVEEPRPASSTTYPRLLPLKLKKLGLSSGFLAIVLSLASIFGIFGVNDYASAAELVATSPAVGSTLTAVPAQVIFGFDGPLQTFGTALYVNGKRVRVGVAERGRDAQEAVLGLNGLNVAGTYEVFWEATAEDKSVSSGKIRFVVKAQSRKVPAATPAPAVPVTTLTPPALPANPLPAETPVTQGGTAPSTALAATAPNPAVNPTTEVTPSAANLSTASPAVVPASDPAVGPTQITIVVTTILTKPTRPSKPTRLSKTTPAPKATKAPITLPPAAPTTATLADAATNAKNAVVSPPTAGTPAGQSPTGVATNPSFPPVSTKASKVKVKVKVKGTSISAEDLPLLAQAATTPTLGTSDAPAAKPNATTLAKAAPETSTSVATPNPVEPPTAPAASPTSPAPTSTTAKPTTTTTVLLSPDTVPASDIEVSFEDPNGLVVREASTDLATTNPTTTRKKRTSITDALGGTTVPSQTVPASAGVSDTPVSTDLANTAPKVSPQTTITATNTIGTIGTIGTIDTIAAARITAPATPATTLAVRRRTEAEIVSGTDAASADGQDPEQPSTASPSTGSATLGARRLRQLLKLAGAGTLAVLLLGLLGLFASLRAPITAFARQRSLKLFGSGLAVAILAIAVVALARELIAIPRSWPRIGLKALGSSALVTFAFIRRHTMKRGLSVLTGILPSPENVGARVSTGSVATSLTVDAQVPKSLRLGSVSGQRAKGRHAPELVRRLRKASFVEAIFGGVALMVAAVLLFV